MASPPPSSPWASAFPTPSRSVPSAAAARPRPAARVIECEPEPEPEPEPVGRGAGRGDPLGALLLGGNQEGFLNRGKVEDKKHLEVINKESETAYWSSPRGLRLMTRTFRPEGKAGAIVFFFHGIGGHCHRGFITKDGRACNDLLLGRSCVGRGWAAFLIDAEGHGYSDGDFVFVPSHQAVIDDCVAYVRHVVSKHPGTPYFVSGESWGGNLALNVGLRLQEGKDDVKTEEWYGNLLVAPAVIGDLPPCPVVFTLRYCCAPCCPRWIPPFMPNPVSAERIWKDEEVLGWVRNIDALGNEGSAFRLGTATQLLGAVERMQRRVADVKFPFAVAHGGHDEAVLIEGSQLLFNDSQTGTGDKAFETFDDAYHDLLADPDRERVMKFLLGWAEKRMKAGKPAPETIRKVTAKPADELGAKERKKI